MRSHIKKAQVKLAPFIHRDMLQFDIARAIGRVDGSAGSVRIGTR